MQTIIRYAKEFIQYVRNNSAVSALEYAILVGVIVTAIGLALVNFSGNIENAMKKVGTQVEKAGKAAQAPGSLGN